MLKDVYITVTNQKTGETYFSRSYPDDDFNNNGKIELYNTPVYWVSIKNDDGIERNWKSVRFMPYWNDPKNPNNKYKSKGKINAGLHQLTQKAVTYYDPNYGVSNRYSPFAGAIQLRDSFLIHAGPKNLSDSGWGSAGCVEIIGDFNEFKNDIKELSGTSTSDSRSAILELVRARKLFVEVEYAIPPNIFSKKAMEV